MKILLMGPVGSGKGTIGEMLSKKLNVPLISIGQTLREVPSTHPRYAELQEYMRAGKLVPQDFVASLLKDRVNRNDCINGFIMDGWGRTSIDLKYFDPIYDKVVLLNISPETAIFRLGSRRTCKGCGKVYNIVTVPPKKEGICDVCGGELYQREDDTKESILKRLDIYKTETQEVIDDFRVKGILDIVDAEPAPEVVMANVQKTLSLV